MSEADRDESCQKHLESPQPGDYWHDMYSPVCVVLGVLHGAVVFIEKTVESGDGWFWDLESRSCKTLPEFSEWLRYTTNDRTWAIVIPGGHISVLQMIEMDSSY